MSEFDNDTGPLKLKRSISPNRITSPTTKFQNQNETTPLRPQTASSSRLSMQDTIPNYQLPITRPRSATSFNQKETTRPTSASAIVRNIITSPIKSHNSSETMSRVRGQSAPSIRQSNTEIPQTEKISLNKTSHEKSPGKKESMRRLVKTVGREYGLPSDVFEGPHYSNDTLKEKGRLSFLSRSSSTPEIYSDQKKKGINWTRKM